MCVCIGEECVCVCVSLSLSLSVCLFVCLSVCDQCLLDSGRHESHQIPGEFYCQLKENKAKLNIDSADWHGH